MQAVQPDQTGPLFEPEAAAVLAFHHNDAPLRQHQLRELAVFFARLESAPRVSASHVLAAIDVHASTMAASSTIERPPYATVAQKVSLYQSSAVDVARAAYDTLSRAILSIRLQILALRWRWPRQWYIAAMVAVVAIPCLVTLGLFLRTSSAPPPIAMDTPSPEVFAPPPPAPPTPIPVALSTPEKAASAPPVAEPAPTRQGRHKRKHHQPPTK